MVQSGQTAPDFALPGVEGETPAVYELFRPVEAGEAVLLWFVPATFLPIPTAELRAIEAAGWHGVDGLRVWVLSADSIYAAAAYADRHGFSMPFLGDAGGAAEHYGVAYEEFEGHYGAPKRAVFLVDPDWTVGFRWATDDAFAASDPSPVAAITGEITGRFSEAERPPSVEYGAER
jgi:peroxiredoxin